MNVSKRASFKAYLRATFPALCLLLFCASLHSASNPPPSRLVVIRPVHAKLSWFKPRNRSNLLTTLASITHNAR